MSPRAFLGFEKTFNIRNFVKIRNRQLETRTYPQKYIGVGYRDKGTAAISHLNGNPPWQEVASVNIDTQQRKLLGEKPGLKLDPFVEMQSF